MHRSNILQKFAFVTIRNTKLFSESVAAPKKRPFWNFWKSNIQIYNGYGYGYISKCTLNRSKLF